MTLSDLAPQARLLELFSLKDHNTSWDLEASQWQAVQVSWQRLQKHLDKPIAIYGTHTHFGANQARRVDENFSQHQLDLLEYLQVGVGTCFSEGIVRRALRLQAAKMAQGYSGLQPEVLRLLIELSNRQELPPVPRHGSLGASGDLVPMAHAVAPIFEKIKPAERDVLALVNTNAMMASVAIEALCQLWQLWHQALEIHAKICLGAKVSLEFLELMTKEPIQSQRPEQALVARKVLEVIADLQKQKSEPSTQEAFSPQPKYSLRCSPQILGVTLRQLKQAEQWILEEAIALSDNPIIFEEGVWHGGLFYASGLSAACDLMQDVVGKVAEWLDRQVLLLMDPMTSGGLAYNLEVEEKSHCKGLHQLINALCQRLRALAQNCRLMSFSCESHNQDVVPCAMEGCNLVMDQLEVLKSIVESAKFCATRAWQLRQGGWIEPLKSLRSSRKVS